MITASVLHQFKDNPVHYFIEVDVMPKILIANQAGDNQVEIEVPSNINMQAVINILLDCYYGIEHQDDNVLLVKW
jgi:hypothetical protein